MLRRTPRRARKYGPYEDPEASPAPVPRFPATLEWVRNGGEGRAAWATDGRDFYEILMGKVYWISWKNMVYQIGTSKHYLDAMNFCEKEKAQAEYPSAIKPNLRKRIEKTFGISLSVAHTTAKKERRQLAAPGVPEDGTKRLLANKAKELTNG